MTGGNLLQLLPQGLYCPVGDFFVDPCRAVDTALITHAHSDHARKGAKRYFAAQPGLGLLKERLGQKIFATGVAYGEKLTFKDTTVSFHPAGHILGSAQVRIEHRGEVWVVSGDYKRDTDPTCDPFEVVPCDVFVTEATFGLPMYRWDNPGKVGAEIHDWWMRNAAEGVNSILFCYSLGKAQRILAELAPLADRPVRVHTSMSGLNDCYRREGVRLAETAHLSELAPPVLGELILAPPQSFGTKELLRFGRFRTGFASGWMQGSDWRRYDRGFPLSDHADWPSLLKTIQETGARRIYIAHRDDEVLAKYLRENGLEAALVEALKPGVGSQQTLPLIGEAPREVIETLGLFGPRLRH